MDEDAWYWARLDLQHEIAALESKLLDTTEERDSALAQANILAEQCARMGSKIEDLERELKQLRSLLGPTFSGPHN